MRQIEAAIPDVANDLKEVLGIVKRIAPILSTGLYGNPRQTKRFLNTLLIRLSMAKAKGVKVERRLLAKLMLLEYFKSETFRVLGQQQAEENGKPKAIGTLEKSLKDDPQSDVQVENWVLDFWLRDWLISEPSLDGVDLRTYFYLSRDKFLFSSSSERRLSPNAQLVFESLLSRNDVKISKGLKSSAELSPAEASVVLEELSESLRKSENYADEQGPLVISFKFVEVRKDTYSQLQTLLSQLAESELPSWAPPRLLIAAKNAGQEGAARQLLTKWASSTANKVLASGAKTALKG